MCSRFIDEFKLQIRDNGVPCHPMKEIIGRDNNQMIVVVPKWKSLLSSQNIIEMG
jgi:hypothetical protein